MTRSAQFRAHTRADKDLSRVPVHLTQVRNDRAPFTTKRSRWCRQWQGRQSVSDAEEGSTTLLLSENSIAVDVAGGVAAQLIFSVQPPEVKRSSIGMQGTRNGDMTSAKLFRTFLFLNKYTLSTQWTQQSAEGHLRPKLIKEGTRLAVETFEKHRTQRRRPDTEVGSDACRPCESPHSISRADASTIHPHNGHLGTRRQASRPWILNSTGLTNPHLGMFSRSYDHTGLYLLRDHRQFRHAF